uniref:Ovule protein n=1 Tax=Steinernema glaseri TaxID=37863 RepID=A0A1I8ASB0_9BILA
MDLVMDKINEARMMIEETRKKTEVRKTDEKEEGKEQTKRKSHEFYHTIDDIIKDSPGGKRMRMSKFQKV